jgi:hypothetical protein
MERPALASAQALLPACDNAWVLLDLVVRRQDHQAVRQGLTNQQTVEGVAMNRGESLDMEDRILSQIERRTANAALC